MKRTSILCLNLFAMVAVYTTAASADIVPTSIGAPAGPVAGLYTYSYSAIVDSAENLIPGSVLCFAGVAGLAGTPTAPTGWTATDVASSLNCPTAPGTTAANLGPTVMDTYSGPTVVGQADLGTFTFQSIFGGIGSANLVFDAMAQKQGNNSVSTNQGFVNGPVATPEPASLMLLGSGLILLGTKRFRRSKQ